jgi:integrase
MGQLESDAALAQLTPPYRHLVTLLAETGLRAGDACALPVDPLVADSAGWPCLRFHSAKMRAEHLLPLSTRAVDAVRRQQQHVTTSAPGSRWLFPPARTPACRCPTTRSAPRSPPGSTGSGCATTPAGRPG